ncbi:MAG: hypothetical protein K2L31_00235, partial [Muribaculum sp.]|nr:hypothetical protein [Muribaculum sp.]
MKPIRSVALLAALLLCVCNVMSQALTWSVDFNSVFDNREGDRKITAPKTYFFTVLAPEVGVRLTKKDRIAGGIVWTQHLTNDWDDGRVTPTLYYRHESKRWSFSMGMFPRTQLRRELPGFLWCDSLTYFQRNIRGALVQYNMRHGWIEAYLDWRGMQSTTRREAFNIVVHGEGKPRGGVFLVGGNAMMNHFALQKNAPADQHIVDNFLVNPYIGLDFSRKTALDLLVIKAGALLTVERNRANDDGWKTPAGGWLELEGEWRWLGLKNSFYMGGKLFPSYGEFGAELYQG